MTLEGEDESSPETKLKVGPNGGWINELILEK